MCAVALALAVINLAVFVTAEDITADAGQGIDNPSCGLPGNLPCASIKGALGTAVGLEGPATIRVKPGIYLDDCSENGTAVTRGISIIGDVGINGQDYPLLDCGGSGRAFFFQPSTLGDAMFVETSTSLMGPQKSRVVVRCGF